MLRRLVAPVALALLLAPAVATAAGAGAGAPAKHVSAHRVPHHRHHPAPKRVAPGPASTPVIVAPVACADTSLIPAADNVVRIAAATLCLVNQQRAAAGLAPLLANAALAGAATGHSLDMVANNYLDHTSPSGGGPLERVQASGYLRNANGYSLAEDITGAIGDAATPAATVGVWMSSPLFRENILSPGYTDTGIGVAPAVPALDGTGPGATYTEEFGATG
jgi:uncharacterized protein YkwD